MTLPQEKYPTCSKRFLFNSAISFHEAQENAFRGFTRRNSRYNGQRIGWAATKFILEEMFWREPR